MLLAFCTCFATWGQNVSPSAIQRRCPQNESIPVSQVSAFAPHSSLLTIQTIISDMLKFPYAARSVSLIGQVSAKRLLGVKTIGVRLDD